MRKLVIVKVGSTLPSLAAEKGDFEDWILSGMAVGDLKPSVVDVLSGAALPGYDEIAGVVITGSHSMVTEHQDWSERTAAWLPGLVEREIPVLGICYGHQLLAYALGGQVGDNPLGREIGTVTVQLEDDARQDLLLGGFSSPLHVQVSHAQTVLRLPPGARRLAYSHWDQNQAYIIGGCAWGVQFHPEFDARVVQTYIRRNRHQLIGEGQDPDQLLAAARDTPYGVEILKRFAAVVQARAKQPAGRAR